MIYTLSEKAGFKETYSSRGITVSFTHEDAGLTASDYVTPDQKTLMFWRLVEFTTKKFLTILVLQGRINSEDMGAELLPIRKLIESTEEKIREKESGDTE